MDLESIIVLLLFLVFVIGGYIMIKKGSKDDE